MIEKPKRPKQLSNQERKIPANIQELITRYDLDNTDIYDYLEKLVEEIIPKNSLLDLTYPVGSVYMSLNSINPSELFGGSWERIGVGRTLISAGGGINPVGDVNTYNGYGEWDSTNKKTWFNVGEKGGEIAHKLTNNELPSHAVTFSEQGSGNFQGIYDSSLHSAFSVDQIGNQSHNIIQPYLAVYMWKRIA